MSRLLPLILSLLTLYNCEDLGKAQGNFGQVRHSKTFVDKTNFIDLFLNFPHSAVHITAPPGFGKSVNLDMIKKYLDLPVTALGEVVKNNEAVESLFTDTNFYKNQKFQDHFLKYKVLHTDFSPLKQVMDLDSFHSCLASVVCDMQKDYQFLNFTYNSGSDKQRQTCLDYHKKNKDAALDAGENLITKLDQQFHQPIIILVDAFDALLHQYMTSEVKQKDVIESSFGRFLQGLIQKSLVKKSLMVGSLTLGGVLSSLTNNTKHFFAHENETIAQFFGFTEGETEKLFNTIGFEDKVDQAKDRYGGYTTLDNPKFALYNPLSIVDFFSRGGVSNGTRVFADLTHFKSLFANVAIGQEVERIVFDIRLQAGANLSRYTFSDGRLTFRHVDRLRRGMKSKYNTFASEDDINLFLQYLFELGYLKFRGGTKLTTSPGQGSETVTTIHDVTLDFATAESRKILKQYLTSSDYYETALGTSMRDLNSIGETLLRLPGAFHNLSETTFKIFNSTWSEAGIPVSMTGAFEAAFVHNSTLKGLFRLARFQVQLKRDADGFPCWDELDAFFITGQDVGIIVKNKVGDEYEQAYNYFHGRLDRGCEDVYEMMQLGFEVRTRIFVLINLAKSRHSQVFYRVLDSAKGNFTEGFAAYPPGVKAEWEEAKPAGHDGLKSIFDLQAKRILESQRMKMSEAPPSV